MKVDFKNFLLFISFLLILLILIIDIYKLKYILENKYASADEEKFISQCIKMINNSNKKSNVKILYRFCKCIYNYGGFKECRQNARLYNNVINYAFSNWLDALDKVK